MTSLSPRRKVLGDLDFDGVPDPLDIDDDGDKVLDNLDRTPGARAAQAQQQFGISSELLLGADAVNVNAGSSVQQIEATLASQNANGPFGGRISIQGLPGDFAPELDCGGTPNPASPPPRVGGLVYCSTGGTGRALFPGADVHQGAARFPDDFDPDHDGFGTLSSAPGGSGGLYLSHGANSSQIRTGDVLIQRVVRGGVETQFAATVQYVFVTGPALVSYSDTAGNAATVSNPIDTRNPFPVAPGADGRTALTWTFFRPQRRRIPGDSAPGAGESAEWTDIGGLTYTVDISNVSGSAGPSGGQCPQDSFSTADPNLTPASPMPGSPAGGLADRFTDTPASPANTLTFTLDASRCLASVGVPSWNPGVTVGFNFRASPPSSPATAYQSGVPFRRKTE